MGRFMFTASFGDTQGSGNEVNITSGVDIFTLVVPTGVPVRIHEIRLFNAAPPSTELADKLGLYLALVGAAGSGGFGVTPTPHSGPLGLAETTFTAMNDTQSSSGVVKVVRDGWHADLGYYYFPPEKLEITWGSGQIVVLGQDSPPFSPLHMWGSVTFEEFRG